MPKMLCGYCLKETMHRKVKTDTLNNLRKVVTQYLCMECNPTGAKFGGWV